MFPVAQDIPHIPQLWSSLERSLHTPAHSVYPSGQEMTHVPPWQICPGGQALLKLPQFRGSFRRS
jgi:hypothetical protein